MPSETESAIDPQLAACLAQNAGRPAADVVSMTPQEARRVYAESRVPWNDGRPEMAEVRRRTLQLDGGEMPAVEFVPRELEAGALVYLHGGGWVTGSTATHDGIMRGIAGLSRRTVVGLDYPLAPESRRAATLAACVSALRGVMEERDGPVLIGGDSAGAELSLAVALELRARGGRLPEGLVLAYPALWPRFDTPSHRRAGDGRFGLSTARMRASWRHYLGDGEALPERLELAGFPRCFLLGAALDCLLDDTRDLARQLRAAGVRYELRVPHGSVHGFLHYASAAEVAQDSLAEIARFVRDCG